METLNEDSNKLAPSVNGTDDREARSKFWIAAYLRPRSEKKLAVELTKLGIENYLPTQTIISQWSDRKKKIEIAAIPMIIFIRIHSSLAMQIKTNPLVIRILSLPGEKKIAQIPDKDIERLKFILGQSEIPITIDFQPLIVKDNVRIMRGPLMGITGEIINAFANESEILVSLNALGGARLKINRINLEKLTS